jgi:hypothetical protein
MKARIKAKRLSLGLGILLLSCSTTRHTTPANADALAHLVLIIRELPDGQVTHSWRHAEDFDFRQFIRPSSTISASGRIVLAAHQRDCHAEYLECHRECKNSKLPPSYRHIPRGSARHDSYCWEKCKRAYLDCEKLQELQPREFTAVDSAVDWLKRNHKAVLAGTLVVVAGVVFVVISAGAGLIVLAPAALVAS